MKYLHTTSNFRFTTMHRPNSSQRASCALHGYAQRQAGHKSVNTSSECPEFMKLAD